MVHQWWGHQLKSMQCSWNQDSNVARPHADYWSSTLFWIYPCPRGFLSSTKAKVKSFRGSWSNLVLLLHDLFILLHGSSLMKKRKEKSPIWKQCIVNPWADICDWPWCWQRKCCPNYSVALSGLIYVALSSSYTLYRLYKAVFNNLRVSSISELLFNLKCSFS